MWFFGAVFLSLFPALAKDVLHGDEQVASLLPVVFSIGIGTGSLLCEVLNRRHVEIGLVPLGAIGMTFFFCRPVLCHSWPARRQWLESADLTSSTIKVEWQRLCKRRI